MLLWEIAASAVVIKSSVTTRDCSLSSCHENVTDTVLLLEIAVAILSYCYYVTPKDCSICSYHCKLLLLCCYLWLQPLRLPSKVTVLLLEITTSAFQELWWSTLWLCLPDLPSAIVTCTCWLKESNICIKARVCSVSWTIISMLIKHVLGSRTDPCSIKQELFWEHHHQNK